MRTLRVVMPVHNGGDYLRSAIDSVLSDLPPEAEFVIVDDGSSDESRQVIQVAANADQRVTILRHETPQGVSAALNLAIQHRECPEYVAVAEHDDIVLAGRFAAQLAYLVEHPECGAVSSTGVYLGPTGRTFGRVAVGPRDDAEQAGWVEVGAPILISHPAIMYRMKALEDVGLYASEFDGAQDLDIVCRIVYAGGWSVRRLPDVHFQYRLHQAATSFEKAAAQRDITRYVAYRNPLQRDGRPFLDYATWRSQNGLSRWQRLTAARKDYGALLYRKAGLMWVSGKPVRAGALAAASAVVNPAWVAYKMRVLAGHA